MAYREIPEGSVEIQTGLWLYSYNRTIGGTEYTFRYLYSSEGYCFYDNTEEIYREDENGEIYVVPADEVLSNERKYMQYASLGIYTDINNYISIPVDPSYEIVNKLIDTEIA